MVGIMVGDVSVQHYSVTLISPLCGGGLSDAIFTSIILVPKY